MGYSSSGLFGPGAAPAVAPRIQQAIDGEIEGNAFANVGAVFLPAGALKVPANIFAGATTAGPDGVVIELRQETGGTLIATWTGTGTLAVIAEDSASDIVIPAADVYNIRLRGNGASVVAKLKSIDWEIA